MSDEPLGDDSNRSYDVTFSNPLFDFNDDFTCYVMIIHSLMRSLRTLVVWTPPESTLVINESIQLVTPLPDPKISYDFEDLLCLFSILQSLGLRSSSFLIPSPSGESKGSHIRLFIKGKKHGRMMLDSIDNGPLVYLTVQEDGQTRPKKYSELTEAQQLQDECDVQATNIILHGLPPDVYALVNHQEAAKDI
ncbi:hypothetical protein Tco_0927894 [Tanacetum coccineum]